MVMKVVVIVGLALAEMTGVIGIAVAEGECFTVAFGVLADIFEVALV